MLQQHINSICGNASYLAPAQTIHKEKFHLIGSDEFSLQSLQRSNGLSHVCFVNRKHLEIMINALFTIRNRPLCTQVALEMGIIIAIHNGETGHSVQLLSFLGKIY